MAGVTRGPSAALVRRDFRSYNLARDRDRIGGALGSYDRRTDVGQGLAVGRLERAMHDCRHAAGSVRQDDDDAALRTEADRLARQKLTGRIEQDGGGRTVVDVDTRLDAIACQPMLDFESAAPDAQRRVRA